MSGQDIAAGPVGGRRLRVRLSPPSRVPVRRPITVTVTGRGDGDSDLRPRPRAALGSAATSFTSFVTCQSHCVRSGKDTGYIRATRLPT